MGGPRGGGIFFDKLKGCGGESLRRLFRLDFCIFEFFIKSFLKKLSKSLKITFFDHFAPPGPPRGSIFSGWVRELLTDDESPFLKSLRIYFGPPGVPWGTSGGPK